MGLPEPRIYQVGENRPLKPTEIARARRVALAMSLLKKPPPAVELPVCADVEYVNSHMAAFPRPEWLHGLNRTRFHRACE